MIADRMLQLSIACFALSSKRSSNDEATVKGDLASLAAAVAMAGYLSAGAKLREWMPMFLYALPVTGGGSYRPYFKSKASPLINLVFSFPLSVFVHLPLSI